MAILNELVRWNWWSFALLSGGVMAFLGNMFTAAVFWRRRAALRRASYLLINLAIADLWVGVGAIAFSFHGVANASESAFIALALFMSFFAAASICSLTIIAVERAFAITKPLKHRAAPTAFYYRAIGFVWTMTTVASGFLVMFYAGIREVRFVIAAGCAACLLTIFLSYFTIWLSSKRRLQEDIHAQERNKKLATNLLVVTIASLATWMPVQVMTMFSQPVFGGRLHDVFSIFEVVNSLLNPFIYTLRMPEFRRELKRLCFRGCCDPTSRGEQVFPMQVTNISNQTAARKP